MVACPCCDRTERLKYDVFKDEYTCFDCGLVSTVNECKWHALQLMQIETMEMAINPPWVGTNNPWGERVQLRPLYDQILIKPLEAAKKSEGGLHIPDSAQRQEGALFRGKVLAIGKGERDKRGERVPLETRPGDEVLYYRSPASEIKVDTVDETCVVIHEEQYCVAVIER